MNYTVEKKPKGIGSNAVAIYRWIKERMKTVLILLLLCIPAHAAFDPSDFYFDWRSKDQVFLHDRESRQVWLLTKCKGDIYDIRCPVCKDKLRWLNGRKIWRCKKGCK